MSPANTHTVSLQLCEHTVRHTLESQLRALTDMSTRGIILVLSVLVVVLAKVLYDNVTDLLQLDKQLQPETIIQDSKCSLVPGNDGNLVGAEDMQLGKHGIVFVGSSGSIKTTVTEGAGSAVPGGLYTYNISSPHVSPVKLSLDDLPDPHIPFQVHGIFVSRDTDRLYTVTHRGKFSSIEIFAIQYHPAAASSVSVKHVHSIRSPAFPAYGINDVIEGRGKGEVYVSQWLLRGMPVHGMNHPSTLEDMVGVASFVAYAVNAQLLQIPGTRLLRCVFSEEDRSTGADCTPATDNLFVGANGLATTADRSTVFVSDPGLPPVHLRRVHVLHPTPNGRLEPSHVIRLPHAADNIEYDDRSEELVMGTMPLSCQGLEHAANESALVAGGMITMKLKDGSWTLTKEVNHEGRLLRGATSSVVRTDGRMVFGSPTAIGVLVCNTT